MQHKRRRSAAITLVLAGTLSGCGEPEPQRDVYTSLAACQQDWNAPAQSAPANDQRHSSSWFYGPAYYGNAYSSGSPLPSPAAMEAFHVVRGVSVLFGGFGSTGLSFFCGSECDA